MREPNTFSKQTIAESSIVPPKSENAWVGAAWKRLDQLTKPKRSLGRLEDLAARLCGIQRTLAPQTKPRGVLVFAGDHGVCEEGVSAFPQSVTIEMMKNMAAGGAAVSVLSRLHDAKLTVIDVGSALPAGLPLAGVARKPIREGTRNFTKTEAMTDVETRRAIEIGREHVRLEHRQGTRVLVLGEMGIGNTTPATALVAAILRCPVDDLIGRGTGIDDAGLARKRNAIEQALSLHEKRFTSVESILACVGGYELAALVGAMLEAVERALVVLLDGFIVSSTALAASAIHPAVRDVLIAAHESAEPGHARILHHLGLNPVLRLDMRLGEASGALAALPVLDAAAALFNDMSTFESSGVSQARS